MPEQMSEEELDKLTEVAREKHMFMHEQAVAAYHEEQARIKRNKLRLFQKEDPYANMSVREIIKENPLAINEFRAHKIFSDANGLGVYSASWNNSSTMVVTTGHDRSVTSK